MFMIQIYRDTCAYLCTLLGIRNTTRWEILTPLDPHVHISQLGAYGFFQMLQRKRGSSADRLKPHSLSPPAWL